MIKMPSVVRNTVFCIPLAMVASCGSGTEAIQGTRVNINPASVAVSSVADATPATLYIVQTYQIELRSPNGYAQTGTQVTIVSSGLLYDGFVVIDPTAVSCSTTLPAPPACTNTGQTAVSSVYETTTDGTGTVRVTLLYPFYSGSDGTVTVLEAFSGSGYGKSDIVFTCLDDPSGTPTCG